MTKHDHCGSVFHVAVLLAGMIALWPAMLALFVIACLDVNREGV